MSVNQTFTLDVERAMFRAGYRFGLSLQDNRGYLFAFIDDHSRLWSGTGGVSPRTPSGWPPRCAPRWPPGASRSDLCR